MNNRSYVALPETPDMLKKIKHPREKTTVDRIENVLFIVMVLLFITTLIVGALAAAGWIPASGAKLAVLVSFTITLISFLTWSISQLIAVALALKGGFLRVASRIDQEIKFENTIIAELAGCDPKELRQRAAHLDLKVKRLTRRAGVSTVLTAIGVTILNLRDAGQGFWGQLDDVTLFVYAGTLGVLIGAALLIAFVTKLEKISGIFMLAANRSTPSD